METKVLICGRIHPILDDFIPIGKVWKNGEDRHSFRYLNGYKLLQAIMEQKFEGIGLKYLKGLGPGISGEFEALEMFDIMDLANTPYAHLYLGVEKAKKLTSLEILDALAGVEFGKALRLISLPVPKKADNGLCYIEFFLGNCHSILRRPEQIQELLLKNNGLIPVQVILDEGIVKVIEPTIGYLGRIMPELYKAMMNTSAGAFAIVDVANVQGIAVPKVRMYFQLSKGFTDLYQPSSKKLGAEYNYATA